MVRHSSLFVCTRGYFSRRSYNPWKRKRTKFRSKFLSKILPTRKMTDNTELIGYRASINQNLRKWAKPPPSSWKTCFHESTNIYFRVRTPWRAVVVCCCSTAAAGARTESREAVDPKQSLIRRKIQKLKIGSLSR